MSDQKALNEQQSLNIIHEMIGRARGNIRDSPFYMLLWGWVVFAGSIAHFVLLQYTSMVHPEWAWSIILIGIIGSVAKGIKSRKESGKSTYMGELMSSVWMVFLLNYFILVFFIAQINFQITPIVLLLTAGSLFISGIILKVKSVKWGAGFIWLMSILAFCVTLPYQLLTTAAAILVGYLVPGYMLNNNEE